MNHFPDHPITTITIKSNYSNEYHITIETAFYSCGKPTNMLTKEYVATSLDFLKGDVIKQCSKLVEKGE